MALPFYLKLELSYFNTHFDLKEPDTAFCSEVSGMEKCE